MQATPLFYRDVVPLDRNDHGNFFLAPKTDYYYTAQSNAVFLAAVEFRRAAQEYPIVFGDDGSNVFPVAVLGLRDQENLYLAPDGQWNAGYIPAYVRRYPFILSSQPGSNNLAVCLDQSYPGVNQEGRGDALFNNGVESEFLKQSLDFLMDYQGQYVRTIALGKRLKDLGILETMQANVEMSNGARLNLTGFLVVNRERLINLPPETLGEMAKDGSLELVYLHLFSMETFAGLVQKLASRNNTAN